MVTILNPTLRKMAWLSLFPKTLLRSPLDVTHINSGQYHINQERRARKKPIVKYIPKITVCTYKQEQAESISQASTAGSPDGRLDVIARLSLRVSSAMSSKGQQTILWQTLISQNPFFYIFFFRPVQRLITCFLNIHMYICVRHFG